MRKRLFCLVLSLLMFVSIPMDIFAQGFNENLKVELISGYMETEYKKNEVDIKYEKENDYVKAIIYDKGSGEQIEEIMEKPEYPIETINKIKKSNSMIEEKSDSMPEVMSTYRTTITKKKRLDDSSLAPVAYVTAQLEITADFSWAQIDDVVECYHEEGESGKYTLEKTHTLVDTMKFPTQRVQLSITGVIETGTQNGVSRELTVELGKRFGYTVERNHSSNWYARKHYNETVLFSTR